MISRKNRKFSKTTIRFVSPSSLSILSLQVSNCYETRQDNSDLFELMVGSSNPSMASLPKSLSEYCRKAINIDMDFEGIVRVISELLILSFEEKGKVITQSDMINTIQKKLKLVKKIRYKKLRI
jgi:hypothetical protein